MIIPYLSESYRSYVKIELPKGADNLSGQRAIAGLENNVYSYLRIPYGLQRNKDLVKCNKAYSNGVRPYTPGKIPPCPLTGVCYDDDFIEALNKNVLSGMTLYDSFKSLEDTYSHILRKEEEYYYSDEAFKEESEANDRVYLSSRKLFYE